VHRLTSWFEQDHAVKAVEKQFNCEPL